MTLIATLLLVHETKDSAHYAERPEDEECPLLGTVSVQKWALPKPTPPNLRLTLEPYEDERPTTTARAELVEGESTTPLHKGATVEVVKNRLAGVHQPAEWLEQFLGRTGTILWTTAGGAMVKLDDEATWFPYAELKVID
jgi:hypothetical protein